MYYRKTRLVSIILILITLTVFRISAQSPIVPDYPIAHIATNGDGTILATSGYFQQETETEFTYFVDFLDIDTLELVSRFDIGDIQPHTFAISPNGQWLVLKVTYLQLIDLSTNEMDRIGGQPVEVEAYDWNPTNGQLAYSIGTGIHIKSYYGDEFGTSMSDELSIGFVTGLAWNNNGQQLASTTYYAPLTNLFDGTGTVQIWDVSSIESGALQRRSPMRRFSGGGGSLIVWSPSDEFIAISHRNGIALFDSDSGDETLLLTPESTNVSSIAWSPNGSQIAGGAFHSIYIWDIVTGEIVETIETTGIVDSLIWSPTLGIIHNGNGDGLSQNGISIIEPITQAITNANSD